MLAILVISLTFIMAVIMVACSDAQPAQPERPVPQETAAQASSPEIAAPVEPVEIIAPDPVEPPAESRLLNKKTSRTIMVYIVGSDLETQGGAATLDIVEMLESDFDTSWYNVLIYTGGAHIWQNDVIPNNKNMIYQIIGNGMLTVWESPALNMADPKTLSDFLTFGYEKYNTDEYDLILWDHGGGPMGGFGVDEKYFRDVMSLADISAALKNSPFNKNNKLGFVGFDACFMNSIEVAFVLQDYADYMIASQEIEPGWGWDYSFLGNLKPEMTTEEVAVEIIDTYFDFCEFVYEIRPDRLTDTTLSCLNLKYVSDIERGLNSLYSAMMDKLDIQSFKNIARTRSRTKEFGRSTTSDLLDLVDLYHLSQLKSKDYPAQAKALSDALENLIVYNKSNIENANGISLYYPYANKNMMDKLAVLYTSFGFADDYTGFIDQFIALLQGESMASWDLNRSFSAQESETLFFVQLTPEQVQNYAGAVFYVLEKDDPAEQSLSHVFSSADIELKEDGRLYANFSGKAFYLVCPETGIRSHCWMNQAERTDNNITYHVRTGLEDWDMNRFPATRYTYGWLQLRTDLDGTNLRVLSLIPEIRDVNDMFIPLPPVDIYDYSKISIMYGDRLPTYDNRGNLIPFEKWDRPSFVRWREFKLIDESVETFRFEIDDLDRNGEYYIIFNISDIQGNVYSSNLIPITFD